MSRDPVHVKSVLAKGSSLAQHVQAGVKALRKADRSAIEPAIRKDFDDSLDLDAALLRAHPTDPRWDYLLGHRSSGVVALEVHPATDGDVHAVIAKKQAAIAQLKGHLKPGHGVGRWFWAASGRVALPLRSRAKLATCGIVFVGRTLRAEHL